MNLDNYDIEFKIGDVVTFQAYTTAKKIRAEVIGYDIGLIPDTDDDRLFYKLSDRRRFVSLAKNIMESKYFSPVDDSEE